MSAIIKREQQEIQSALERYKPTIVKLVPKHIDPAALLRIVWTAITFTPKLADCTPVSIVRATVQAAMLGLIPNDGRGLAWLIPYGKECQFQAGYKGLIALAYQSSDVQTIHAREVYEGDVWTGDNVLDDAPVHKPSNKPAVDSTGKVLREVIAAYCIARIRGARDMEVMQRWEIDRIMARSAAVRGGKKDSPWHTDFGMMARKTAVKRAARYWPVATERMTPLARALQLDDQAEIGDSQMFDEQIIEAIPDDGEKPATLAGAARQQAAPQPIADERTAAKSPKCTRDANDHEDGNPCAAGDCYMRPPAGK